MKRTDWIFNSGWMSGGFTVDDSGWVLDAYGARSITYLQLVMGGGMEVPVLARNASVIG